ncbi:hypothetical protein MTO96_047691 [Rhipicephalus appendiculatus]
MKAYAILALVVLGHLCQIQAATLSKPATSTDDAKKQLTEKLSRFIMENREDLVEAFKGLESTGDATDEQIFPLIAIAIGAAIANAAVSGEIQAATLGKPAASTDDAKKQLTEKLSRFIMEHREELVEAFKGLQSTGDGTDEQIFPLIAIAIGAAIANAAVSGGVAAGVSLAVKHG